MKIRRSLISVAFVLALIPTTAADCDKTSEENFCSPSEGKNFSDDPGCNFKTVGAKCSKEHRRDREKLTGRPVVCEGKPLKWKVDRREVRQDQWDEIGKDRQNG